MASFWIDYRIDILKYVSVVVIIWITYRLLKWYFHKAKCTCSNRLDGKVVLVTGGNAGIGLETARELARRGASVVIASRDERRSAASAADIAATTGSQRVHHRPLDLASFASVRRFAADFARDFPRLDILVNNAGCIHIDHRLTEDGINSVMQVNYFGPFLLTHLLKDTLIASKPSRIVNLSSLCHIVTSINIDELKGVKKKGLFTARYARSKLCVLLMTKALAKRLPEGVTVNALHPGIVDTDIVQVRKPLRKAVTYMFRFLIKTPVEGCQTAVHLCVSDRVRGTGGYYSECAPTWTSFASKNNTLIEEMYRQSLLITRLAVEARDPGLAVKYPDSKTSVLDEAPLSRCAPRTKPMLSPFPWEF